MALGECLRGSCYDFGGVAMTWFKGLGFLRVQKVQC